MTTTTKLLLALSAATLGVVVWAIRKKSRVGPLGKVNYADVKDPKADTIQEGPPKRIGQGPALKKWKCTSADLKASPWANAVRLVMTKDAKRQGKVVSCSSDLCEQVQPLRSAHREEMHVLGLDNKNRVIGSALVAAGSVAETTVDAAEVFKPALLMNARRVVIVHNHPSGDPTPSPSDVQLTRKLTTAGEYLHVTLLDHLVIGDEGKCISMRDMGLVHRE